jgi:hypothetical protein
MGSDRVRSLRFVNHHNGTASISGTPGPQSKGTYPLTIKAQFGTRTTKRIVVQAFSLKVGKR